MSLFFKHSHGWSSTRLSSYCIQKQTREWPANRAHQKNCNVLCPSHRKKRTLLWHIFTYSVFTLINAKWVYREHSVNFVVHPSEAVIKVTCNSQCSGIQLSPFSHASATPHSCKPTLKSTHILNPYCTAMLFNLSYTQDPCSSIWWQPFYSINTHTFLTLCVLAYGQAPCPWYQLWWMDTWYRKLQQSWGVLYGLGAGGAWEVNPLQPVLPAPVLWGLPPLYLCSPNVGFWLPCKV